ncbi:CENP-Q, a CENPA-CAD centromere complex subunit-domain-containing protein [Apodospora peruviana]|uniref:CENP-Q, a CENPA-CAD centromere complex subunit-domain-containing protein n=1 Tax=Apodospora peruviana TaxID=516989 RepID=A0AAE0HYR6_9PEZI|nr:CENP-Q, a CENPA-CAD centromere complex subunit-domain-containing protein [Apodospora peruviana]
MAREVPNQKRKRGRPVGALKNKEGASPNQDAPQGGSRQTPREAIRAQKRDTTVRTGETMESVVAGQKKRGGPRKSIDTVPQEDAPPAKELAHARDDAESSRPKKRGRPGKTQDEETNLQEASAETRPRKRRRPPPAPEQTSAPVRDLDPNTAARPSKKTARGAENPEQPTETTARRSNRDRRSADDRPWWTSNTGTDSPETSRAGREQPSSSRNPKQNFGRSRLGEVSISEAQNRASPSGGDGGGADLQRQPKKRGPGRRSLNSNPDTTTSAKSGAGLTSKKDAGRSASTVEKRKSKEPGRSSGAASQAGTSTNKARRASGGSAKKKVIETGPMRKGRFAAAVAADESISQETSNPTTTTAAVVAPPKYRHLTSRTRQIPRSTISAKWTALDEASITSVDSIISDAYRPVLIRLRGRDHRHQQAQTILHTFAKRLHSKLSKGMPFPPPSAKVVVGGTGRGNGVTPGGHEMELDFEQTINAIQALEGMLDPLLHSVALLTREKEREEAALERDYKALRELEGNARADARLWRERRKRDHVLAPEIRRAADEDAREYTELEIVKSGVGDSERVGAFVDLPEDDEELTALSQRIGSHMKSMKGNLQQIDGVLPAIAKSKAALQGVLFKYLDPQQYDQVLLG